MMRDGKVWKCMVLELNPVGTRRERREEIGDNSQRKRERQRKTQREEQRKVRRVKERGERDVKREER